MITTYRYSAQAQVKDGETKRDVSVPPPIVLSQFGAFIQVTITHPRNVQEELKQKGKEAPSVSIKALIDTGASGSVITPKVADDLGLVHTGYQTVSSVQDEQQRPVYFGFIIFPWGMGKEIPIVSCPLRNLDCLIGRDILMHWLFTYNGPDGSIIIGD